MNAVFEELCFPFQLCFSFCCNLSPVCGNFFVWAEWLVDEDGGLYLYVSKHSFGKKPKLKSKKRKICVLYSLTCVCVCGCMYVVRGWGIDNKLQTEVDCCRSFHCKGLSEHHAETDWADLSDWSYLAPFPSYFNSFCSFSSTLKGPFSQITHKIAQLVCSRTDGLGFMFWD